LITHSNPGSAVEAALPMRADHAETSYFDDSDGRKSASVVLTMATVIAKRALHGFLFRHG
jgi:hypothetical protein